MVDKTGLEYYEVGGAVRDRIMGNEPNDYDYVVVGSSPEDMKKRGFVPVNDADFPVFLDKDSAEEGEQGDEYALARTERSSNTGYKGFEVYYDKDVTLEEDLERRDFTINAMARDIETGEIIDPYGGKEDIEKGELRHVSSAFSDDPLRVIRMARFAARFNFDICDETMELARNVSGQLKDVDKTRIIREVVKAMKQADRPGKFFRACKEADVFDYIFPEIKEMMEVPAGKPEHHSEGSVFEHSIMVVNELYDIRGNRPLELLGAFFHDIGKIRTHDKDEPYKHYGHEKEGVKVIEEIEERIDNLNSDIIRHLKSACKQHMRIKRFPEMSDSKIIDTVKCYDYGSEKNYMDFLIALSIADTRGRIPSGEIDTDKIQEKRLIANLAIDEVDGDYLKRKHGEEFMDWEGQKIGNVVNSHYCEEFRKYEKMTNTEIFKGV
jgi:tRNA nucleotidyltransferase (CCA-adding enzyme)